MQYSIPVDDTIDPGSKRSSQRAELLAVFLFLGRQYGSLARAQTEEEREDGRFVIITTDSEYVVKGITEWFPTWKRNNWRTAAGKEPANLKLFKAIDAEIKQREEEGVKIGFWHVPRHLNFVADRLARDAAAAVRLRV